MVRKRSKGDGTIFFSKKRGCWIGEVTIMHDLETGKPKKKRFYAPTRDEVRAKLIEIQAALQVGTYIEPSQLTIKQWLETWMNTYKKQKLRQNTWMSYQQVIKLRILPIVGDITLKDLHPDHLQYMYNQMSLNGLSQRSIKYTYVIVNAALKQAVKNRLVAFNVNEAVDLPKGKTARKVKAMTPEEQSLFVQAIGSDKTAQIFYVLLGAGLRRSEALALKWNDINFDQQLLTVDESLTFFAGSNGPIITDTKTVSSTRTIPITKSLVEFFLKQKHRQDEEKLKFGDKYNDQGFVFATRYGTPIYPTNIERAFYQVQKKAGLSGFNVHSLRHTYATKLNELGVDIITIKELLGHARVDTSANIYTKSSLNLKRQAIQQLEESNE